MSSKSFVGTFAISFTIILLAPAVFFTMPEHTHAQSSGMLGAVGCLFPKNPVSSIADKVGVPVTGVALTISSAANSQDCLQTTVIAPLTRMLAQVVLKQITASTINWITNTPGANGTSQPSFVPNLSVNLQNLGTSIAAPFINQIAGGFNSPFGPAIAAALSGNYSQGTTLAGFFAANACTLDQFTPGQSRSDVNSFLAGDWSKGGVAEWFALTTQDQNNPFTLYQKSQAQLASLIENAQTNRRQELQQSGGFLSWCGTTDSSASVPTCPISSLGAPSYYVAADNKCEYADGSVATPLTGGQGINPGDSCTNKDGTPGTVQTPGSIIHDYTQKVVVNAHIDQLVSAQDLDSSLGAIATALIGQVLGGSGLLGASTHAGSAAAPVVNPLQTALIDNTGAAASATSLAQSTLTQLTAYTSAWQTIQNSAQNASSAVTQLANNCSTQATAAQAASTAVSSVLAQAQAAFDSASAAQALAIQVESDASSLSSVTAGTLSTDMQALVSAPPSASDVINAQSDAAVTGGATASPSGSLAVSGGSLIDQMNLVAANAAALDASCTQSASPTP